MQKSFSIDLKIKYKKFKEKNASLRGCFYWKKCDFVSQKFLADICIDKEMARSQQLKTLIHEFTHFLLDVTTGINGTIQNNPGDRLEEKCCLEAEETLYKLIKDYRDIM